MLILIQCPECQVPAEVTDSFWLPSTDGDVEHVVVDCLDGHHLRMPVDRLSESPQLVVTMPEPASAVGPLPQERRSRVEG